MKLYSFNKYIAIILSCLMIISVVFSCYINVYADNQGSGGNYGSNTDISLFTKIYDGFDFSESIAKHESFYFTDKAGNKHAVARAGSTWICLFATRATFNGSQDEQLNYYLSYYAYTGYKSISNTFCNFLNSKLGLLTKGGSTFVEDYLSSNISSVADGISYNESDDSISLDSSSIDALRKEIKEYYYNYIGIKEWNSSSTVKDWVSSKDFREAFQYEEDYNNAYGYINSKYCITSNSYMSFFSNNLDTFYISNSEFILLSMDNWSVKFYKVYFYNGTDSYSSFIPEDKKGLINRYSYYDYSDVTECTLYYSQSYGFAVYPAPSSYKDGGKDEFKRLQFHSSDNSSFKFFSSYSALYNYMHGDQNAYLSSQIEKTGEDISFNIKDMNENLGEKMDSLIDTINSKKEGLTSSELQDLIDKGLDELNKNTDDIKDNTEQMNNKLDLIIEALNTQNQTLLDILGLTKKIADTTEEIEKDADFNSLVSLLGTVFLGIESALLYGQNTMRDSNVSTETASLSDDDIVSYSSGGGTSFDYRGGIFGHFPFSVIYHLYDWLKVLQTEPKCPEFTYNYGFLIGKKDDDDYQITFDLSQYESWRNVASSFMKLSFTLAVAIGTYKKFKGGDLS